MKFGFWSPRGTETDEKTDDPFAHSVATIQKAESFGFVTTLIAQRYIGTALEAWVLAGALAAVTSKIELMIAVHPGIVHPQLVAKMGATLDQISHGRCALNIVNGWHQEEMTVYGNGGWLDRSAERYRRMDEFLQVLQGLWTQDQFAFQGEFFKFDATTLPSKPVQKPHPPIYAGTRSDAGREIVASRCQHWFATTPPDFRAYEDNFRSIESELKEIAVRMKAKGRTVQTGLSCFTVCADTQAEAEAIADNIQNNSKAPQVGMGTNAIGAGLVGTPDLIAERIRRYEEAGLDLVMLRFPNMIDGIERIGRQVMPLLAQTPAKRRTPVPA